MLEKPLDCKEIKPINPKGNQYFLNIHWKDWCWRWSSILWPPGVKSWLIRKYPVAGKDWRQGEKGMTEDEMVGWHHRLNGHEFEQVPGDSEGQGSLACYSPWDSIESDMAEWLNNNRKILMRDFKSLVLLLQRETRNQIVMKIICISSIGLHYWKLKIFNSQKEYKLNTTELYKIAECLRHE